MEKATGQSSERRELRGGGYPGEEDHRALGDRTTDGYPWRPEAGQTEKEGRRPEEKTAEEKASEKKIGVSEEKAGLRRQIRSLRQVVTAQEKERWDEALCRRFFRRFEKWRERELRVPGASGRPEDGEWVYLYMDIRNEAGTMPILRELWRRHIRTAVPRVEGKELQFYKIESLDQLTSGHMGILEPMDGLKKAKEQQALVVVPGVAFDHLGHRLGYGGGFYDRFFSREPRHPRWALAYGFQMVERIPWESWDERMDVIVTPEEVWGDLDQRCL